jgi:hypothetical protein
MHLSNPEVSKMGILFLYYILQNSFRVLTLWMKEWSWFRFSCANNLVSALLVTSDWSAFQTHSIFKDISEPKVDW